MRYILILISLCFIISCKSDETVATLQTEESQTEEAPKKQRPIAVDNGKVFEKEGEKWLFGGSDDNWHFNITNCVLVDSQFHYGIGREKFPALLKPEFTTVDEANSIWKDDARFLLASAGDDIKAYSIEDLTHHEIVNDELDGEPIMAAYCILADLGAIYDRRYGEEVLTFALSGYTYYDPEVWDGVDGFVFWDRETESLWWPLIGKAVSGPLNGVKLLETDKSKWQETTWGKIKIQYPKAQVMKSGQDYDRPKKWKKLEDVSTIISNYTSSDE